MKSVFLISCILLCTAFHSKSQQNSQNIRGQILDSESEMSLPGATVSILNSDPLIGTSCDLNGNFVLEKVAVGRISLEIKMMGYEDLILSELPLTSGKELFLNIKLTPAFEEIEEVVIRAESTTQRALNEMATVSSRSFSVEETQRYAASAYDPGRMALAFSGVATAGDDILNEISIRGNSPRGMLWRMEGIEIPNPNHFGSLGSSGGGISMLSSSTLSSSDFYTGAFPAEFGNASSGVFDLNLRNGNNQIREHSFMFGALGLEGSTEGYFNKGSQSSYLINYRYSTFALISTFYNPIGDVLPEYSDISFKLNFPNTSIGSVSIFGLGGMNNAQEEAISDTTQFDDEIDNLSFRSDQSVGVIGIKHVVRLNDKAFIKTVSAFSANRYTDESFEYDLNDFDSRELFDITTFKDDQWGLTTNLNYKFDSKNTLKTGASVNLKFYDLVYDNRDRDTDLWTNYVNSDGNLSQYDVYAQWKRRISENWTTNVGFHTTYLPFNQTYSLEPRTAISYRNRSKEWNLALGLHSKPEHVSTYFLNSVENDVTIENAANKSLEIPKAIHAVLGHRFPIGNKTVANIELYYQYHFDIPVEAKDSSLFSTAIASDIWGIVGAESLVSEGEGRNYGIDISVQRSLSNNYYYMLNTSVYKAEYSTYDGRWFNSRYNGDYIVSMIGGKEWQLKNENKSIGINTKLLASGGNRITPVNLEESLSTGEAVYFEDRAFEEHAGNYLRFDLGFTYKINRPNSTHTLIFDVQNVTGKQNVYTKYFDEDNLEMETVYQLGVFPFINYRIEFQSKR